MHFVSSLNNHVYYFMSYSVTTKKCTARCYQKTGNLLQLQLYQTPSNIPIYTQNDSQVYERERERERDRQETWSVQEVGLTVRS
jgi:hypothetical protein